METFGALSPWLAFAIMVGAFALLAAIELVAPFRAYRQPRRVRWFTNLALFAIDTALVRLLLPLAMVGTAALAAREGWGLLNVVKSPAWLAFAVTIFALDLALWVQHWATHRVPLFWRFHRVHHADNDFDVTTAARFHPVEIVVSMVWKMGVVAALGAPVTAVFTFEVVFAVFTLWTHANVSLPGPFDEALRRLIVTPDMHRIHHSVHIAETNSNYGTVLSGWDKLFATYTRVPESSPRTMPIGLTEWRDERPSRLGFSLLLPFRQR